MHDTDFFFSGSKYRVTVFLCIVAFTVESKWLESKDVHIIVNDVTCAEKSRPCHGNMTSLRCVAHYTSPDYEYSQLIQVSSNSHVRLLEAKQIRLEQEGQNEHAEQCANIPDNIDDGIHGIHMEPCYKRFIHILYKRKSSDCTDQSSSKQHLRSASESTEHTILFPDYCYFCKRKQKKVYGKMTHAHKLTLASSEKMIKDAANDKNDVNVLRDIHGVDLLAKEFKVHDKCRRDYTRKCEEDESDVSLNTEFGEFDLIRREIQNVIENNKVISMTILHTLYDDGHDGDSRYRYKLKQRILKVYPDELYFLQVDGKSPEIVVSKAGINSSTLPNEKSSVLRQAAKFLREDILEFADKQTESQWPPTIDMLMARNDDIPQSVTTFLTDTLKTPGHVCSDKVQRHVNSYASDLINGVTQGNVLTLKHFLIGLGLHNITGQKLPIRILSNFGHSADYLTVCQIETGQAEISQILYNEGKSPGLQASSSTQYVHTYFWADNFNMKTESNSTSMIDSTHMIKFQEHSNSTIMQNVNMSVQKRSRFSISKDNEEIDVYVNAKKEPSKFCKTDVCDNIDGSNKNRCLQDEYCLWNIFRMITSKKASLPKFSGWKLLMRKLLQKVVKRKSLVTYLPPINASVTSFTTIMKYLTYMQKLCSEVNMPYVNVTLDVGAAMNAYKVIWNYPDKFDNVLIHLGDFHLMKEIFSTLGLLIQGSGFEEIVFQSGLATSGSLNGIISGSHYNRCWKIHEHFAEALDRLLLKDFMSEQNYDATKMFSSDDILDAANGNITSILADDSTEDFIRKYMTYKEHVRQGMHGKTAKFWLVNYLDIINILHAMHTAVQESDYDLRLEAWTEILPYFFATDRTNYSRYGSIYVSQLLTIDKLFPGCKQILQHHGISVQGQDRYPLCTAVDQRGEQTFNRDAKTSGGITNLAANIESVTKWTLNRSAQAKITKELKTLAGIESSNDIYQPLRPHAVVKSCQLTNKLVDTISEDFISPFDKNLQGDKLYNLSSGIPIDDEASESMLSAVVIGKKAYADFINDRVYSDEKKVHDTLPKVKLRLFKHCGKKVSIKTSNKTKVVEVNRDIISTLLAISAKTQQVIDFESALQYPLSPVPLNIANVDGSRRGSQKYKLMDIILNKTNLLDHTKDMPTKGDVSAYILDLMALTRMQRKIPNTYEELALQIVESIPKGYRRVHIVADTYRTKSIKDPERLKRGCADKIIVNSATSRLPRNFNDFLQNGENKTTLINLIQDVIIEKKVEILEKLQTDEIVYSNDNVSHSITKDSVSICEELSSNQEEADTKLALHTAYALQCEPKGTVIVRNHSGDVDINVILISLISDESERVILDCNKGKDRKVFRLSDVEMTPTEKNALVGLHAFTGNDYVSAFFRKGKITCWNTVRDNSLFWKVFEDVGKDWVPSESLVRSLEEFVCKLFGSRRLKDVNEVRFTQFEQKYKSENKIIDLSLLPPCKTSLHLHILRSCYVARIWRSSLQNRPQLPPIENHGWTDDGQVKWIEKAFPQNLETILLDLDGETEYYEEQSDESEDEDD